MDLDRSVPLSKQLHQLLSHNGGHSKSGKEKAVTVPVNAAEALRLLPATWNLGGASSTNSAIGAPASASTSGNEVHKLALRIEGLLKDAETCGEGLQLVCVLLEALPWHVVAADYAANWLASALPRIQQPGVLGDAIAVCDILLGVPARSQPEYWRQIGAPNATKYGLALIEVAEKTTSHADKELALSAIARQVVIQPSLFRTHAPRLHKICLKTLFEDETCTEVATKLLARLPFTGKGPEAQAQLWSATVSALLNEAKQAWAACSSTLVDPSRASQASTTLQPSSLMVPLPTNDDILATHEGHRRLALLLGAPPSAGILPIFLACASPGLVNIPLDGLVSFVLEILATSSAAPAHRGVETTLHATQTALLSLAHLSALALSVSIPLPAYYNRQTDLLLSLLRHVEQGSPTTRCAALHVIDALRLPTVVDPSGMSLVRCVRTCLAQAARILRTPSDASQSSQAKLATSSKANKRRRLFDADQVVFRPTRGFVDVGEDELDAVMTALAVLSTCFESLVTYLTPEMHDLAHTTALLILGMTEFALKESDEDLAGRLLHSLASIVRTARGAILGLLCPRAANLCANGLAHPSPSTRLAAKILRDALADAVHPKLPPKLALRLHIDHDQVGGNSNAVNKQEPILGDVELAENAGARETEALRDVLSIRDDQQQSVMPPSNGVEKEDVSTSSAIAMARHASDSTHAHLAGLSPDPVKPLKRPNTPRIGSPSAAAASLSPDRRATAASGAASPAATLSSPSSMFRGARRSREGVDTLSAHVAGVDQPANVDVPQDAAEEQSFPSIAPAAAPLTGAIPARPKPKYYQEDDDSDSDSSIPEIDMRSSGEESEADE